APVEHVHLTLDFHGIAVDGVLDLERRIRIEMSETTAEKRRAPYLPEQPRQRLGSCRARRGEKRTEFLREIEKDGAGLEDPNRTGSAAVEKCGNLRVRIYRDEPAAELLPFLDPDQPGVVFGFAMPGFEQLFEHHRDLDAVGRSQRIELQRVTPHRQLAFMCRTGHRSIDALEAAPAFLVGRSE